MSTQENSTTNVATTRRFQIREELMAQFLMIHGQHAPRGPFTLDDSAPSAVMIKVRDAAGYYCIQSRFLVEIQEGGGA
jgi:hypothetical protein